MKLRYYLINLDRSTDRLAAATADLARVGVEATRIPAVDGRAVPEAERRELDVAAFRRLHGKRPMGGEYGCYASHLHALDRFVSDGAEFAVILEDDVVPLPTLPIVVTALINRGDWDVVRLAHHRAPPMLGVGEVADHRLGTAFFGPTGSSAAYLVRREAAARLRAGLTPMRLPYDTALERGWALGLRVRDLQPDLVRFNPQTKRSLTREEGSYASRKLKPWQRLGTLAFRSRDLVSRIAYAVRAGRE